MSDLYTQVTPQLIDALIKAQSEFPSIAKSHTNPHFKSKYADLSDVLAAVRPALSKNGIFVSQPIRTTTDGPTVLRTELLGHGGALTSEIPLYLADLTPQQLGSTLTYYRRYSLAAILGVVADDDDDGNAAQRKPARQTEEVEVWELKEMAQSREALLEAISGLSDDDKELVKLELRNQKVPSLKKPGATRAQLDALVEFIAGLRERAEPFDTTGAEPPLIADNPHDKPFTPTTFDEDLRNKPPSARQSIRNSMREPE
jgi:hypothetical protein